MHISADWRNKVRKLVNDDSRSPVRILKGGLSSADLIAMARRARQQQDGPVSDVLPQNGVMMQLEPA